MVHNFISWRLNESISSARTKFLKPGLVDQTTFDQLKALDPTPTFKYLEKIIRFYLNDKPSMGDLKQAISRFHTLLNRNQVKTRDINAFKSFNQLKSEVQISDQGYSNKQENKAKKGDYELVFENDDWIVMIPRTQEASCKYGAGTKWCIAAKNDDDNQYIDYIDKGATIYYIISKKLTIKNIFYKMAVVVHLYDDIDCFDSKDDEISFDEVLDVSGLDESIFISRFSLKDALYNGRVYMDTDKIEEKEDGSIIYHGSIDASSKGITSLKGSPKFVKSWFNCSRNNITSLDGGPEEVGDFICDGNKLTSLKGAPKKVNKDFDCRSNNLTSLEGAPNMVGGNFDCSRNNLTSLEGAPSEVAGDFICFNNNLHESEKIWARKNIKARGYKF